MLHIIDTLYLWTLNSSIVNGWLLATSRVPYRSQLQNAKPRPQYPPIEKRSCPVQGCNSRGHLSGSMLFLWIKRNNSLAHCLPTGRGGRGDAGRSLPPLKEENYKNADDSISPLTQPSAKKSFLSFIFFIFNSDSLFLLSKNTSKYHYCRKINLQENQ